MLKYVLLDLDGTLIDTTQLILESYRHTVKTHLGFTPRDEDVLPGFGTPLYKQLAKFTNEGIEEMAATYRAYNLENHNRMVTVFPGVRETLCELADRDLKLAIVTSKTRHISQVGLDHFGLSPYITLMVSMEDTDKHKPDPAPVLKALELLGAQPDEAIFVGDSPHDIAAGQAAGVKTAGVSWGAFEESVLLAGKPDYFLRSMPELLAVVDGARSTALD